MYTVTAQTYSPDGAIDTKLMTIEDEVKVAPTLDYVHRDMDWLYQNSLANPEIVGVIRTSSGRLAVKHADGSVRTYTVTRFGN